MEHSEYIEQRNGGFYVAGMRVSLDSIVYSFKAGDSPETIRQNFSSLTLEQVYGAIGAGPGEALSIRFQADNDLKRMIVDATLRREPGIDFQTAQAARLDDLDDAAVLRLAPSESRILVSHDKRKMPAALASFVASGGTSPGVLLVIPQNAPIREVVAALILIWADDRATDWNNLLIKIPFRRPRRDICIVQVDRATLSRKRAAHPSVGSDKQMGTNLSCPRRFCHLSKRRQNSRILQGHLRGCLRPASPVHKGRIHRKEQFNPGAYRAVPASLPTFRRSLGRCLPEGGSSVNLRR
jgi:hypothetical protein